jgi:LysM repeat protein
MALLVIGLMAGCTRERATEEPQTETGSPLTIDDTESTVDEPDVVILPANSTDTPSPDPTDTPEPAFDTIAYTVQPGDSVSTVAEKFGTTSQNIRELNLLTTDALQVGQVLRVPNTAPAQTSAGGTPQPTAGPFSYVVQEGDTLYSIAINFGVSPNDIVVANTLGDPNSLFEGQTILIPNYQPESAATPTPEEPYLYVIQAGDTLLSIAEEFGVSATALAEANTLRDPNNLIQGQTLTIPGYQGSTAPEGQTDQSSASQPGTHVVEAGETLLSIAQNYGITVDEIVTANALANPNLLTPGQTLVIPGVSAAEIEAANRVIHVVAAGEGLYAIARQYNVTAEAIMEANDITNPNLLTVGQELIIPDSP